MSALTINKLVFDGSEQDFYSFKIEIKCPICNSSLSFLADDMTPMENLNLKPLPKNFTKQLNLKRRSGGKIFEDKKGLETHSMECKCNNCRTRYIVFAGINEIQPSRFNVIIDGILTLNHP